MCFFRGLLRLALTSVGLLIGVVAGSADLAAQTDVYTPGQLTELPDIADRVKAAEIIQKAYPPELKERKIGGTVHLRFIVNADGTVDTKSVKVIAASHPALGVAAAAASKDIRFKPGKLNGKPVRTVVVFPLNFVGDKNLSARRS
jgi:TonB family protein